MLRRLLLLSLFVFSMLSGAPARADGFVIIIPPDEPTPMPHPIPRPPPRPAWFPLSVKWHRVKVTIDGQVATTEVDEAFQNPNPSDLEGTYIFPLPEGASVSKFSLFMGGKEVESETLDAGRAREVYERIVRRMKDPGLLEYAGRGAVKARIYPIPANGQARVKLSYQQVLPADGGLVEYRYPLSTEKWSAAPLDDASIHVEIGGAAVGNVWSPSHAVQVARTRAILNPVIVDWSVRSAIPDRDFLLYYNVIHPDDALSMTAISHRPAGEDGTFMLLLSPGDALADARPSPKDVVFVLDTSGSMQGEKMDQAKEALRYCVRALSEPRGGDVDEMGARGAVGDRLAIVDFSTDVRTFKDELIDASGDGKAAALAYADRLRARGGTDICGALLRALSYQGRPGVPFYVVFVTDGEPTVGVTEPEAIEKAVADARAARPDKDDVRLFVFGLAGVRNELNAPLLDRLAEAGRGAREYVAPRESVEVKVSRFFDKISSPVLTDVKIEIPGAEAFDMYPRPVPDLFRGGEVAIVGRYRNAGARAIRVKGRVAGKPVELVAETRLSDSPRAPFLPRIFAVRKVAYLLDQIRLHGESAELRSEVVRLAREHGIVTPYTSFLVIEDERQLGAAQPQRTPSAAARAIEELRRRDDGYSGLEREAAKALRGDTGGEGGRDTSVAGSESLRRMAEAGTAPETAAPAPAADAAGTVDDLRARFASGGKDGVAGAEREKSSIEAAVHDLIATVDGRTFYRAGDLWVDSRVAADAEVVRVVYLSDAYFALVREKPGIAPFLALGPRVRLAWDGKTLEVVGE